MLNTFHDIIKMNQKQKDKIAEAVSILQDVFEEEDGKLDNMSEHFSETERYQEMSEKRDELEEAINNLEEIINS